MIRIYQTGLDNNQIHIQVQFGTVGIASTIVQYSRPGNPVLNIAVSNVGSGNITNTFAGYAGNIRNGSLYIKTVINLNPLPPAIRQNALNNMTAQYTLTGGFSGIQSFSFDPDDRVVSPSGYVIVTKQIVLQ